MKDLIIGGGDGFGDGFVEPAVKGVTGFGNLFSACMRRRARVMRNPPKNPSTRHFESVNPSPTRHQPVTKTLKPITFGGFLGC